MSVAEPVPAPVPATVVLLGAVNQNQDEFVASDLQATANRFSQVFFHETVGEDIYDAIASKTSASGEQDTRREKVSRFKFKFKL
jgi:hypothetical protein